MHDSLIAFDWRKIDWLVQGNKKQKKSLQPRSPVSGKGLDHIFL